MVSNRGHDSIAAFRLRRDAPWLEPLGHFPAGGRTPRDIAFTPDGAFLLIASQDDHLIRAHCASTPSPACPNAPARPSRCARPSACAPAALNRKPST